MCPIRGHASMHAPFRWRRMRETAAAHVELHPEEPMPFSLAAHMPALAPV